MGNSKKDRVSTQVNYDCEDPFVEKKKFFRYKGFAFSFFLSCFLFDGIMNVSMLIVFFCGFNLNNYIEICLNTLCFVVLKCF